MNAGKVGFLFNFGMISRGKDEGVGIKMDLSMV